MLKDCCNTTTQETQKPQSSFFFSWSRTNVLFYFCHRVSFAVVHYPIYNATTTRRQAHLTLNIAVPGQLSHLSAHQRELGWNRQVKNNNNKQHSASWPTASGSFFFRGRPRLLRLCCGASIFRDQRPRTRFSMCNTGDACSSSSKLQVLCEDCECVQRKNGISKAIVIQSA